MQSIREDANTIIHQVIQENLPNAAVESALKNHQFCGEITLIAIGKAAWTMAKSAYNYLGDSIKKGLVITKYEHSQGAISDFEIVEAGHPIPDENSILGAQKAIDIAKGLGEKDELLFLISGGGSSLFEKPLDGISLEDITHLNSRLLSSGADITEINLIRKRLSGVKAGRFAMLCAPAKIFSIVLSDVIGDRLDAIASGPAAPDPGSVSDAIAVVEKYNLKLTDRMLKYIQTETPKAITNVHTVITGSVRTLCQSAANAAKKLGYYPVILTTMLDCEAREAGCILGSIAHDIGNGAFSLPRPCAVIAGGETIVHLRGNGLGGRNQELALAAAIQIQNLKNTVIFSLGSDGTDGPTDAAGGIVDGNTVNLLKEQGLDVNVFLENNDAYNALKKTHGLLFTGPTGTNVNDISMLLCK